MSYITKIYNVLLRYEGPATAQAMGKTGWKIQQRASTFTSKALRNVYRHSPRKDAFVAELLADIQPGNFRALNKTIFIASSNCEQGVDAFLAKINAERTHIELKKFKNGESYARIGETVRDKTVVIFQDFKKAGNINDAVIETMLAIDAAKRADAKEVMLFCSSLPYIDDAADSYNYQADYFKLVLNLLFKAAGLDKLQIGKIRVDRVGLPFLLEDVFGYALAPYLIAKGEKFLRGTEARNLAFLIGKNYQDTGEQIVRQLHSKHQIEGDSLDFNFWRSENNAQLNSGTDASMNLLGKTVYVFQTCNTGKINDDFMEALLMIYTAKKKGAKKVVLVMPYLPYNRQERKAKTRESISAKVIMNALVTAGVNQIIALDPHAPATQGFVDIPFQYITASKVISDLLKEEMAKGKLASDYVPVSPDAGRAKAVRRLGTTTGTTGAPAFIDKYRPTPGAAKALNVVGGVKDKDVVFYDDLIDTGGTLSTGKDAVINKGAKRVFIATIHPVFSDTIVDAKEAGLIRDYLKSKGKAIEEYITKIDDNNFKVNALIRLQAQPQIAQIIFTNSLVVPSKNIIDPEKIKILSITDLLAKVCSRIIQSQSLQDYQYEAN
jgi:ribose-phosphate pyrophosphokinase